MNTVKEKISVKTVVVVKFANTVEKISVKTVVVVKFANTVKKISVKTVVVVKFVKRKDFCKDCGGSQICEHGKHKSGCKNMGF